MQKNVILKLEGKRFFYSDFKIFKGLYVTVSDENLAKNAESFNIQRSYESCNVAVIKIGSSVIVTFYVPLETTFFIGNNFNIEDFKKDPESMNFKGIMKELEFYSKLKGDISYEELIGQLNNKTDGKSLVTVELRKEN